MRGEGPGPGTRDPGGMEKPARGDGLGRESGLGAVRKEDGGGGTGPVKARGALFCHFILFEKKKECSRSALYLLALKTC